VRNRITGRPPVNSSSLATNNANSGLRWNLRRPAKPSPVGQPSRPENATTGGVRALSIVVAAGPDRGRTLNLDRSTISIGRGHGETLQLSDSAVSRHHLTLRVEQDPNGHPRVCIAEIAGVNPPWMLVDGARTVLNPGDAVPVGEHFSLGNTTLQLLEGAADLDRSTVELDAALKNAPPVRGRLAALAELGDRLARCTALESVYREATAWALGALPATRALLLSTDGRDVLAAATDGAIGDLAISQALLSRVLREQRAFWVRDVLREPDLADRRSVQLRGIAGAMVAPSQGLVFYAEWNATEALRSPPDEEALMLLVCAAHLVSALGQNATERAQLHAATRARPKPGSTPRMIGRSPALQRLEVFVERVAPTASTVLLRGESGTGKELAASMIHAMSEVAGGPFVAINCAAMAESVLESELFGHERGAFTGAIARHEGVFVRAHGGTLFLDEIGEMSLSAQARLLRVLETRLITRVGGTKEVPVHVRLIAATNRDLLAMAESGAFRMDLYYRLSVLHTVLPPLRERREDIEALVQYFVEQISEGLGRRVEALSPEAIAVLERYPWPGNVRELRNVVERALVLGDGPTLELDDLPPELALAAPPPTGAPVMAPAAAGTVRPLAELEAEAIAAALAATAGNKARAAALLGIDRTTLYRKLKLSP